MSHFFPTLARIAVFHIRLQEKTGSGLLYRPHSEDFTLDGTQWVWVYSTGPLCTLGLKRGDKVLLQDGLALDDAVPDQWEVSKDLPEFKELKEMQERLGLSIQTKITWESRLLAIDE